MSKYNRQIFKLNRILLSRSIKGNNIYSIVVLILSLLLFGFAYIIFVYNNISYKNDFCKQFIFMIMMILYSNYAILEYRFRNHLNISFKIINRYPISPAEMLRVLFKIFLTDIRLLLYFSLLIPLTIGIILINYSFELVIYFVIFQVLYFLFCEILFTIFFILREQLNNKINNIISNTIPMLWLIVLGLNLKNMETRIPFVNLPAQYLFAIQEGDILLAVTYFWEIVILSFIAIYSGYWLSKRYI
jgi:hypothetical protein